MQIPSDKKYVVTEHDYHETYVRSFHRWRWTARLYAGWLSWAATLAAYPITFRVQPLTPSMIRALKGR